MLQRYRRNSIVLLLLIFGTGCQEKINSVEPAPVQFAAVTEFGLPESLPAEYQWRGLSPEASLERLRKLQAGMSELVVAIRKAESWEVADRQAREILQRHPGRVQHNLEQIAALEMMQTWLFKDRLSRAQREALSYYAGLMIHNNSPMAGQVHAALVQLEGHWPEAQLREAAARAAAAAEARVEEKQLSCSSCSRDIPLSQYPEIIEAGHNVFLHETLAAVHDLRQLAGR